MGRERDVTRFIFIETVKGEVAEVLGFCSGSAGWRSISVAGDFFVSNFQTGMGGHPDYNVLLVDQRNFQYRTIDVRTIWEENW